MAKRQLKIKLLPNGEVQMETIGIKGKKCLDYVEFLRKLADVNVEKKEFTSEYYEETQNEYNTNIQDIEY